MSTKKPAKCLFLKHLADGYPKTAPNDQYWTKPPFLMDTAVSGDSVTKITAWFMSSEVEENIHVRNPKKIDMSGRGEDWKVELVSVANAKGRLPPREVQILEKAIVVKQFNGYYLRAE